MKAGKGQLPIDGMAPANVTMIGHRAPSGDRSPMGRDEHIIYAIWITGKNWIKIGYTSDWHKRKKHYRRNYGKEGHGFHVLVLVYGSYDEEQHIHHGVLYSARPVHGDEYYAPEVDVTDAVHDLANGMHTSGGTYWENPRMWGLLSDAAVAWMEHLTASEMRESRGD